MNRTESISEVSHESIFLSLHFIPSLSLPAYTLCPSLLLYAPYFENVNSGSSYPSLYLQFPLCLIQISPLSPQPDDGPCARAATVARSVGRYCRNPVQPHTAALSSCHTLTAEVTASKINV